MAEEKLDVAHEEFLPPVSNLTIGIDKSLDGIQKNKHREINTQTNMSNESVDPSYWRALSPILEDSAEVREMVLDLIDGTLFATSADISSSARFLKCETIPDRFGPESIALRRRFGMTQPETEKERITIIELRKEKDACRNQEAEKIAMQSVDSSHSDEMVEENHLEDIRLFCKTHGFAGINVPRKRLNCRKYALHCAVKRCDSRMVGLLLRAGADPKATDSRKQTPFQLAEQLHRFGKFDMTAVMAQFFVS